MTYKIYRCPHCGYVIHSEKTSKWYDHYGSPIDSCGRCGKTVINKMRKEIFISGLPFWAHWKLRILSIAIMIFWLIMCISAISNGEEVFQLILLFTVVAAIYPIWDFINYGQRAAFFKDEMERSKKRMADPNYVESLKALGINIPG